MNTYGGVELWLHSFISHGNRWK